VLNLGALVPLDNLGHYFHWHWIFISFANLTVIGLMVVVFVAAILTPFPGRKSRRGGQ
jgi:predicted MFS family arabinose efflux permease